MKILMICTEKLPVPPIRGGAIQTYIEGVSSFLREKHELTILGINDPSLPDEEIVDNITFFRIPGGLPDTYCEGIQQFLEKRSFDLIHIFNRPRFVLPVRKVAPHAKLVLSMHNDMFKPQKIDPLEAAEVIEQLDKIITISDFIGKTISNLFPEAASKLKTIYSGVDLDRFVPSHMEKGKGMRDSIRSEHNLLNKKVILFAGRLSANKGVDVLIKAIPLLTVKHPDIALVIVGSKWFDQNDISDYVAYVRALASRLSIPVINTGFVSPQEIQKWFAAADIFVCPSQWQEPLARVHYEAMASGLPIVTTERGGNPEVIVEKENGIVIKNPEDPQEFADQLSYLLSNPSLAKKMGEYGRGLAETKYNWQRVAEEILSVWYEVENKISVTSETELNDPNLEDKGGNETINEEVQVLDHKLVPTTNTTVRVNVSEKEEAANKLLEKDAAVTAVTESVIEETKVEAGLSLWKPKSKKEKIRDILFLELTKSNPFLEELLSTAEAQTVEKNEDEIQKVIKQLVKNMEKQFNSKEGKKEVKRESTKFVEVTNDITTARLFKEVMEYKKGVKRRRKSS
ncbi:MAG: glycosyltransferase family 4 protein [Bacillaceae bacterium]|mgnify:CR=1 FL=1|nr:glycosyltransferase family 4 protein [Bacillaceae bacterium]